MISIRKAFNDLDRIQELEKREELSKTVLECYALAIESSAHYAVELDPGLAVEYRSHLRMIEQQARAVDSTQAILAVQASFRGELREYRDRSAEQTKKLRREVEEATAAMLIFADTVTSNGDDHEKQVTLQLQGLESVSQSNRVEEIRGGITAAVSGIRSSIQQIHRANQLIVAQLQDEIRTLHQQFEMERKALYTDRDSGAWNRHKIDTHLDNLRRQNQPFCLLLVCVRNYKRLETQHSRTVLEGTLKSLVGRFSSVLGPEAIIGRWSQDQFVAVTDIPQGQAIPLSAEASRKLSGTYAIQENGLSQKVAVHATAGFIDGLTGVDASRFQERLAQLATAISGA